MFTGSTHSAGVFFEALEDRMMLSAAHPLTHHHSPHHAAHHHAAVHAAAKPRAVKSAVAKGGDPIYMQFEGINGDVTANGFANDIQLNSFQWGVGRIVSSPTGSGADRQGSAPSISEITITKNFDSASPGLLQDALIGDAKNVKIFFVNTVRGKLNVYAEYDLTNVLISGYSVSSGGDRPTESLSLNFTKIEFKTVQKNADGTVVPVKIAWDLSLAEAA